MTARSVPIIEQPTVVQLWGWRLYSSYAELQVGVLVGDVGESHMGVFLGRIVGLEVGHLVCDFVFCDLRVGAIVGDFDNMHRAMLDVGNLVTATVGLAVSNDVGVQVIEGIFIGDIDGTALGDIVGTHTGCVEGVVGR